ncbi:MAG: glycosyltransferase family 2 protein [Acidobacteria bacterium]|nr:glycosyltransferase family 2 protein [Acidobacteriota bacterium]
MVLDLHYRGFMTARLIPGRPEAPAAVTAASGKVYRWQFHNESFFAARPDFEFLLPELSDQRLARLMVQPPCPSIRHPQHTAAGTPVTPVFFTIVTEKTERSLPELMHQRAILFRLGRHLPASPVIQAAGNITEVICQKYDLSTVGGLLREIVGDDLVFFIVGDVSETPPLRLSSQFALGFREGAHIVFPNVRWATVDAADRLAEIHHAVTPLAHMGFIPPEEITRPHPFITAQLRYRSLAFCCRPDTWLSLLPFQRVVLHPGSSLVEGFTEFLLHGARERAGFFYAPDTSIRFAVRRPLASWLAWTSACRLAACAGRYSRGRRHHWDIHQQPTDNRERPPAAETPSPTKRAPCIPRQLAALAVAARSFAGWTAPPYFPVPVEPMGAARYDLFTGETVIDASPVAPRFLHCRIFMNGQPCGLLGLPLFSAPPDPAVFGARIRAEFFRWYADRWLRHLAQREFDALEAPPPPTAIGADATEPSVQVTALPRLEVVLATHDRPAQFRRVVGSLRQQQLPVKLRVVDSNPLTSQTREFCRAHDIPYLLSPPPGKSRAVNLGIRASTADILLFIDDDAVAHPEWSEQLRAGFCHPGVMCVTGLALPLETTTPAQYYFETHMEEYEMGGLRRGYTEREYRRPYPFYRCSHAGTGACMAIRREAFDRIGLFAQTLSPGTPCRAGEEVDFFFRLLKADFSIVYNPRAMVWHDHRRKMSQLTRLIFNYGVSTGSFSTRWFLRERGFRSLYYLWRWNIVGLTCHALRGRTGYPTGLLLREVAGVMAGPAYYASSCAAQAYLDRRMRRHPPPPTDHHG